jgi:hypothetical protein
VVPCKFQIRVHRCMLGVIRAGHYSSAGGRNVSAARTDLCS